MSRFREAMPISLTATSTELPDWQHTIPEWPDLAPAKMKLDLPRINSGMVPRVSRHRRFPYVFLVKTHISLAGGSAQVPEQ